MGQLSCEGAPCWGHGGGLLWGAAAPSRLFNKPLPWLCGCRTGCIPQLPPAHPPPPPPRKQTSGNDVFYRNPFNVEENVFVNVSSPSSSKCAVCWCCAWWAGLPTQLLRVVGWPANQLGG